MIGLVTSVVLALSQPKLPSSDPSSSQWGYVALGWGISAVVLVTYVIIIIMRGRSLSRRVPPEERRWM